MADKSTITNSEPIPFKLTRREDPFLTFLLQRYEKEKSTLHYNGAAVALLWDIIVEYKRVTARD